MSTKRKSKTIKKFRLSDSAVEFIRKYIMPEMGLSSAIDSDILDEIVELATQWEINLIDPESEDGRDKTYDYPERARDVAADNFVTEITGQWDDDELIPDFDDLNQRLAQN